jgi:hypothetical protein
MTGDPSWVRDRPLPTLPSSADFQGGLADDDRAAIRAAAVPAIAAYRDGGCRPVPLDRELLLELMSFIAGRPLEGRIVPMLFEDMQFDGADSRAHSPADNDAYVYLIGLLGILCKQTHLWMPQNPERNRRLRAGITTSGHSDCRLSTCADIGALHLPHVLV